MGNNKITIHTELGAVTFENESGIRMSTQLFNWALRKAIDNSDIIDELYFNDEYIHSLE